MKNGITDWPHAPLHSLSEAGGYMVTCGTYQKKQILKTPEHLTLVRDMLFEEAERFGWWLQAWAVMSNHYHFLALCENDPSSLKKMISSLHKWTAMKLNKLDNVSGRKVWYNYWDSHITNQPSWFTRLRYVHQNPVHHGVVADASNYKWCSQAWLERTERPAFVKTLASFKIDKVNVGDNY